MTCSDAVHTSDSGRLFFALWPPDEVRSALASAADGIAAFGAGRRVAQAKLHLTLHFLGGWTSGVEHRIERACAAASNVRGRAFELRVDHAGAFPGARVGWLAPAGSVGLDALWLDIRVALDQGAVPYRPQPHFAPHITVRRGVRARVPDAPIEAITWPVDAFVLVHSHDGRYDVLARWPLDRA
ncbi:RNA 2',3'-cyclic phosphodiesterase [Cognatilysobacter lacus]|uniref:RNA 2',3'-cyclic phosphodiesterase n=1 Tax=Cognatilysobacter lacus TaxID=1643323 RepID=A0A5D8Z0U8_9GAMM|nr:RNA 2',3'-cyclic phosphodiesterase [Lysobacter lacus]TZF87702.1 RNA 2',3'-cyclic phosphodiesterase [Lysobacter lacus]